MKSLLAKKLGMTTIHTSDAKALDVSLFEASENTITQIRTEEKDGYSALQVALKKASKKEIEIEKIREFRAEKPEDINEMKVGEKLALDQFEVGEKVVVEGITKGKGFQGVVKKWGFAGSPASHGHRHDLRAPGSIGGMYPQKVFKGKKMAGRMRGNRKTIKNLEVAHIDQEKNLIALKGAVPGKPGSIVRIFN